MASATETGHAKNVANFEDLISFCVGYGITYNPVNVNIKIPALQAKRNAALTALQTLKVTKTAFDNTVNSREIIFAPLKKLSTRIINTLEATTASKQAVDDAKTINRKIQGKRASGKLTKADAGIISEENEEANNTAKTISVSQQSFDSLIDNFAKLIQAISAEPAYLPNENDLKVATLNTLLTNLKTANTSVVNTNTAYSNSRIARNTELYAPTTGLVDLALEVKKYVKSLFGATSPQYKQISGIKFTKPKK
jgi:hypothetical protein